MKVLGGPSPNRRAVARMVVLDVEGGSFFFSFFKKIVSSASDLLTGGEFRRMELRERAGGRMDTARSHQSDVSKHLLVGDICAFLRSIHLILLTGHARGVATIVPEELGAIPAGSGKFFSSRWFETGSLLAPGFDIFGLIGVIRGLSKLLARE